MSNINGYHLNPLYPEYVEGYKSWNADGNDNENEDDEDCIGKIGDDKPNQYASQHVWCQMDEHSGGIF